MDERADVFGLGAILCEILSGRPPYVGPTRGEIRVQAAVATWPTLLARLDSGRLIAELIGLAHDCLRRSRDLSPAERR